MARRLVAALCCGLIVSAGASLPAEVIDRVLAVVGGEIVTLSDARAAIDLGLVDISGAPDPIAAAMSYLVDRELMLAEVQRYLPPEPQPAAIDRKMDAARKRFGSAAEFNAAIARLGLDEGRVRDMMRDELRIGTYLDERFATAAQPAEEDVQAYFRQDRDGLLREGGGIEPAHDLARQRLTAERRAGLLAEWLAGLRRRGEVTELYLPAR